MTRILHWTDGFAPSIGGTEVLVLELALAQLRAGHEVHVVAESLPGCPDRCVVEGVPVHRFAFSQAVLSRNAAVMRDVVSRVGRFREHLCPDLVHVHLNGPAAWFELLSRPPGPRPVLTVHAATDSLRIPVGLCRHILRSAGRVVAVSRAHEARIAAFDPTVVPTLTTVLNGCPVPELVTEPAGFRSGGPWRFACVGRLVATKGFDVVLDAVALVLASRPEACHVAIAGDGPERAALEARIVSLGLDSRTAGLVGWVPPAAMHAWMGQADAVVVPSTWDEPFGLVAVQAAFAARPVIASRVGGLGEIVVDGVTGWLVPAADPGALAARMLGCLDASEHCRALGLSAREHALATFTIDRCRADYDRLYAACRSCISPSPGHANPLLV